MEKKKLHKDMLLFYAACAMVLIIAFGVMIFRMLLNAELKEKLDAIRAQGYPTTLAELNDYYPAVPDSENAAELYQQAFSLFRDTDDEIFKKKSKKITITTSSDELFGDEAEQDKKITSQPKPFSNKIIIVGTAPTPPLGERLSAEYAIPNQQFVKENSDCAEMLKKAINLPKCRFPIDLNEGFNTLLPHLNKVRSSARLLSLKTLLAADNGNTQQATANILALLKMSKALEQEPVFISYLVSIAIQAITINAIERILSLVELDDIELQQISDELEKFLSKQNSAIKRAFAGEQVMGLDLGTLVEDSSDYKIPYQVGKLTGLLTLNKFKIIEFHEGLFAIIDKHNIKAIKHDIDEANQQLSELSYIYLLPKMLLPALTAVINKKLRIAAQIKVTIIGLAIERYRLKYNKLPETLSKLTPEFINVLPDDPFTNKPFRYVTGDIEIPIEKDDKNSYSGKYKHSTIVNNNHKPVYFIKRPGWVVYSLGEDQDDDKGIPIRVKSYSDGDIPFRCVKSESPNDPSETKGLRLTK
jgi:hypothetical protein